MVVMRAAVTAAALLLLSACGGHTLHGTFTLHGGSNGVFTGAGSCIGQNGYDDIKSSTSVTVKDESGKLLATTLLGSGKPSGSDCTFSFSVDVPDANFYQVEVSHRGAVAYSKSDLESASWKVTITLGS